MTTKHELPEDLDNYIAGLRIENINLKLEAKQAEDFLRRAVHVLTMNDPNETIIDEIGDFLASQLGEQATPAEIAAVRPEQAEGVQGERERFEAAHRSLFGKRVVVPGYEDAPYKRREDYPELYSDGDVQDGWRIWQAARAALAQPSPAPELACEVFGLLPEISNEERICIPTSEQTPFCWLAAGEHFDTKDEAIAASKLAPGHTPAIRPLYADPVAQAVQVPDGWKLVPIEPTKEMMLNGSSCQHHGHDDLTCIQRQARRGIWSNMLAAAPAQGE